VPVAWLGGRFFGVPGIFLGICVSNVLVGVASWLWVMDVTAADRETPCVAS
jgi:Na+-driven multidrug efflux pump